MLTDLLCNKYLIRELVARDVKSRYVGSFVGIFWSILNPLLQLALYTVVFSVILDQRFGAQSSTGAFAQFLFCALLPWSAVQEGVTRSSRTFIENSNLIRKIRFPLLVLPFSLVVSGFIHQLLGTVVFLIVIVATHALNPQYLALVFLLFGFQLLMTFGVSLIVGCLNVFFRDIAQILGVAFMMLFWATPIVYPRSRAPGLVQWLLNLNPLTHMVEAYRFAFFGEPSPSLVGVVYWIVFCWAVYRLGRFVLERTGHELLDLI